jgi:tetratricopeptide (TPR) repeat protein
VTWGQTKLTRGDLSGARELFEKGLTLATESRERYQEVRALQYIALAHLSAGDPAETALEMARSSTEWARKMPMMVGIIYGLTFQALALSRLGRHDEAVTASDEAIKLLETTRTDGVEHVLKWRADVLSAAGRLDAAKMAIARAAAEVDARAQKLRDPDLRKMYLASRKL